MCLTDPDFTTSLTATLNCTYPSEAALPTLTNAEGNVNKSDQQNCTYYALHSDVHFYCEFSKHGLNQVSILLHMFCATNSCSPKCYLVGIWSLYLSANAQLPKAKMLISAAGDVMKQLVSISSISNMHSKSSTKRPGRELLWRRAACSSASPMATEASLRIVISKKLALLERREAWDWKSLGDFP